MKDEVFIRGKVPMTKAEVRAASIDLLNLDDTSKKLLDVGAGTGSVGLQVACNFPKIQVTAIERNPDAVDLIKQNQAKFGLENVTVIEAYAPIELPTRFPRNLRPAPRFPDRPCIRSWAAGRGPQPTSGCPADASLPSVAVTWRSAYSASKLTGASRKGGNPPRETRSEITSRT